MTSDMTAGPGSEIGITGYGAWIPRRRIARQTIAAANGWFNPGLLNGARGRRSQANWDEDSLTMAVAALRGVLNGVALERLASLTLASTTLPFLDRQNASLASEACGLPTGLRTQDTTGSLRAGTSALLATLLDGALRPDQVNAVAAADCRRAKPASPNELSFGHAAAAFTTGRQGVIARLLGWKSQVNDLVDHYRQSGSDHDYRWEERLGRDLGLERQAPPLVASVLAESRLTPADVTRAIFPVASGAEAKKVAKACGIAADAVIEPPFDGCGHAGAAQSLLMLAAALEQARPGERILVTGFGQGTDVLLLETTDVLVDYRSSTPLSAALSGGWDDDNYIRFLAFEGSVTLDGGIRAEADLKTAHSVAYRARDALNRLHAGRCTCCGTIQFPPERVCVSPECGAIDSLEPCRLADETARVFSFTNDVLAHHPSPPARYGLVEFAVGGRMLVEFTEWEKAELAVGASARMEFRIKDTDPRRSHRRYFWKAVPA